MDEVKARMLAEGWKEIAPRVFERQLGPNKVEHLGYGREGLAWTVGEMNRTLERLQREYRSYPTKELANTIADLTIKAAKARRELWNLDNQSLSQDLSSITAAVTGPSCSEICYGATADAYELTSSQGVGAVASAKFNSTCGYSGETYAYAYARATSGSTTTTNTQSDPKSGNNITSSASATASGGSVSGIPCYSEASAYAQSSSLGISYSTSDTNSVCTPISCNVSISGTSYEYFITGGCRTRTWTASLSSGCTATSYQWTKNGTVVGTGSSYTQSVCASTADLTLGLTINGTTSATPLYVDIDYEPCECCSGGQICP